MFSIKPKKVSNNEHLNISNDNNENNSVLSIDLKTINFENISVELALNVLQLKHNEYYNMSQSEIIQYYNYKIKLTNNINNILALKIILKYKLKGLDIKINKMNGIMLSENEQKNNLSTKSDNLKNNYMEPKINSIINNPNDNFKIQQIQQNNFKIIQKNITNSTSNIAEISNNNNFNQNLIMNKYSNQSNQSNQSNKSNNFNTIEKINNMTVITSSEFDIDSIINTYTEKKNSSFVK